MSSGIAPWVASALLLHAGLGLVAAALARWSVPLAGAPRLGAPSAASELIDIDASEPILLANPSQSAGLLGAEPSGIAARDSTRPVAGASRISAAQLPRIEPTESDLVTPVPPAQADGAVLHAEERRLSLDQLGVGLSNPLRGLSFEPLIAPSAEERLQASLRHEQLTADRKRHLGPEGPVVAAAHRLALARDTLLDARAVLRVHTDAAGRVTQVNVVEASGSGSEWQRLSEDLLKSLAGAALRLPASNGGAELKLQIVTALRLPSGADPGMRFDLLGRTLSDGAGPRSASLSLSPTAPLPKEEAQDTAGRHMDRPLKLEVGLLTLKGDASDIAAGARRVVEVSVLSIGALSAL